MAGLRPTGLPRAAGLPNVTVDVGFVIKDWFFNGDNVRKHLRDEERIVLNRYGAYVRKVARHSMKNRAPEKAGKKGYASAPGMPPHAHALGNANGGGLKYGPFNILYGYNPVRRSVVIGPRKKPNKNDYIPFTLEYGGSKANVRNSQRKDRKVGGSGAIAYGTSGDGKKVTATDGKTYRVRYARLRSQEMVERSERIEEFLFGRKVIPSVTIQPRPYMRPAQMVANQELPRFWKEAEANSTYFTGLG